MSDYFPRRDFLWRLGGGLGGVALAHLLGQEGLLAGSDRGLSRPRAEFNGGLHHPARARRVIQLFMNGGVSQMDTFDHKPELERRHGQRFDPGEHVEAPTSTPGNLMKSPFAFKQHGECGRWVSSVFPHLANCVDDLAFLMAVSSKTNVHGPASYMMNTGFLMPGFPCMGAWLSYGLGSLSDNLPTFVVLPDPKGLPYNAKGNFTSGFLPMSHQGTIIDAAAQRPIPDLFAPSSASFLSAASQRESLEQLARMNRRHAALNEGDSPARIPHRLLRACRPDAAIRPRSPRPDERNTGDPDHLRPGRSRDRRFRPPLPAGPTTHRTRRPVRPDLERCRRPNEQLGQSRQHPERAALHRPLGRPPDRRLASRPEVARPAR